jgi:hypothetical protein
VIIQRVLKGINGIQAADADQMLRQGIVCNWWRQVNPLPTHEIPLRLTQRNLDWHQNRYDDPDPDEQNEPFRLHTPFISVTAGTVERDAVAMHNLIYSAWQVALEFATDGWSSDGCIFYAYVFVLGRNSVPHQAFSEELRELNVFTAFSPFQPEGEITAKIVIPPAQIEKCEFYDIASVHNDLASGRLPVPMHTFLNGAFFQPPDNISNVRDCLL